MVLGEQEIMTTTLLKPSMRILIVSLVYPPECAPAGINVAELAEELTRAGHKVTVLTGFPSHPAGRLFPGWKARLFSKEQTAGAFTLLRCIHSFVPRFGLMRKLWYHLTFAVSSFLRGLFSGRIDVMVFLSTPAFCGPASALLAKIKRCRAFYWIHDIHPESAINAGLLRPGILSVTMKAIDSWVCRRCDLVAVLTEDMRKVLLDRGLSEDHVIVQRHWVDESRIHPMPRLNAWREKHAISSETFVVLHAGTIGYISGAVVIIEGAKLLRDRREILFLFVGDGPLKAHLQQKVTEYGLTNTRFLPFVPEEDLNLMQATGDVGLITLKPLSATTSIPSKMHGYTAAGRPVIASVDPTSSVARLIEEERFGWVVSPGEPAPLADAICSAVSDDSERRYRGEKAREFFVREFGRAAVTSGFCSRLELLCRKQGEPETTMSATITDRGVPGDQCTR